MESPSARYIPQKSKKRVFPGGGSSSGMDPDVIEISPPTPPTHRSSNSKPLKRKEVMEHEIIDVDVDEECGDVMLINGKVDTNKKGKEVLVNDLIVVGTAAKVGSVDGVQSLKKTSAPVSQNVINLDGFSSDIYNNGEDDYMDMYLDDYVYDDDYAILQSHFDNIDLPTGIEAPIPWLPGHAQVDNKTAIGSGSPANLQKLLDNAGFPSGVGSSQSIWAPGPGELRKRSTSSSSSSSQIPLKPGSHVPKVDTSSFSVWSSAEPNISKKMSALLSNSSYLSPQVETDAMNAPAGMKPFKSWHQSSSSRSKRKHSVSGGATYHSSHDQLGGAKLPAATQPFTFPHSTKKQVGNGSFYSGFLPMETVNPHGGDASMSKWQGYPSFMKKQPFMNASSHSGFYDPLDDVHGFPEEDPYAPGVHNTVARQKNVTDVPSVSSSKDDILAKFQLFKKFDTVEDHSDHHYTRNGSSSKQPSKNWAKKIQDEWKILEKDLPDTIFVRVYESRMDLLRAVIIGAEGTPYHDGLFFFDVFFPSSYPNVPPQVHYHSGGLRINPNLYNCGKVCLSLLNTWTGGQKEKWIPGVSTMLQVLVSIQGLILNAKPYFNEPGYAHMSGSPMGEKSALQYNENTFLLSLKTMLYTMRRPPKYFEDFVAGHFCKCAHDILVACKAYIDGAQVGCLVRGGVQDVDEGDKSCSQGFKDNVAAYISSLVKAFAQIGAKDTEKFLPLAKTRSTQAPLVPTANNYYQPWGK